MRVLILDEDQHRGRQTADSLQACGEDILAEPISSQEGMQRLERGEWFDLVVADPPEEQESCENLVRRFGQLAGPPPLLLVSAPLPKTPIPEWVQGVVFREPGYQERIPEAARLTLRIHRLSLRSSKLQAQLAAEQRAVRSGSAQLHLVLREAESALHHLVHGLHSVAASNEGAISNELEALIESGESAWSRLQQAAQSVDDLSSAALSGDRKIVTSSTVVSEALDAGLAEHDRNRVLVEVEAESKIFADPQSLGAALGSLVRRALQSTESELTLRTRPWSGQVSFEVPWQGDGFLPDTVFETAERHGGTAAVENGWACIRVASVREGDLPLVLAEESLRKAELSDRPFTLMKIEGCGRSALDPITAQAVVKSTDKVLPSPDGGLLLFLNGLSPENTWGVASRVREALAEHGGLLPFRTLTFPDEANGRRDFFQNALRMGILSGGFEQEE